MSGKKIWAGVFLFAQTLSVTAMDGPELQDTMAICAGRMSAEMEFAWLRSDPEADRLEEQRRRFVDILEAIGHLGDPRAQLALRIDAKMAHASLLTTAHFGTDKAQAAWAKRHAVIHTKNCQDMLLNG